MGSISRISDRNESTVNHFKLDIFIEILVAFQERLNFRVKDTGLELV